MKKLALSAILGASLMISSSAFALTAMNDAGMKSATGQAGVSIAIDNVIIDQYVGSTTYTDDSGTNGTAGSIVIGSKHTVKEFKAMVDAADYVADFDAAAVAGMANASLWKKASALSIDVGTCSVLSAGLNANTTAVAITAPLAAMADVPAAVAELVGKGYTTDEATAICVAKLTPAADVVSGVVIGLPTLLISTTADTYTVGVAQTGAINTGKDFIRISKGKSAMAILGGTVEIAAH